jgi:hypothetical protein
MTSDLEVGDTVEYCFDNPSWKRLHGSIGIIREVHKNYYGYKILWQTGPMMAEARLSENYFLPETIKKINTIFEYDPTQVGDTDDDI